MSSLRSDGYAGDCDISETSLPRAGEMSSTLQAVFRTVFWPLPIRRFGSGFVREDTEELGCDQHTLRARSRN